MSCRVGSRWVGAGGPLSEAGVLAPAEAVVVVSSSTLGWRLSELA